MITINEDKKKKSKQTQNSAQLTNNANKDSESTSDDIVEEGKSRIKLSNEDKTYSAFYNPAQEFNRDLSVVSINSYFSFNKFKNKKHDHTTYKHSILEALSATGLRSVRYAKEFDSDKVKVIVANDMDQEAVKLIKQNVESNKLDKDKFEVFDQEATQLLYNNMNSYDVVDLDPYGSAIPLLDAGIKGLKNGGKIA